jgi:hypothetical protein
MNYSTNRSPGKLKNQSEPALAIDPNDRDHVVIVSNLWSSPGFFRSVTTDGGVTWTTGEILTSGPGTALADPTLAFDAFGNLFLAYGTTGGLWLAVSNDGGVSFPENLRKDMLAGVDRPALATGPSAGGWQSVWIAARYGSGRIVAWGSEVRGVVDDLSDLCFSGAIEVTSGCNNACESCPVGQKCEDGTCVPCGQGENCTQPTPPCVPCGLGQVCQGGQCIDAPGEPGQNCQRLGVRDPGNPEVNATEDPDLDCFANYADVAVGPLGDVMVAYNNGAHFGMSPTRPVKVFVKGRPGAPPDLSSAAEPGFNEILCVQSNVCSINGGLEERGFDFIPARPSREKGVVPAPDLAWDRERNERLYLAYLDKPTLDSEGDEDHDTNIVFLFADSPYASWQPQSNGQPAPKLVNDDYSSNPPSPVNSQFFHRIAVDQTTGHVAISWLDTRPIEGQSMDLEKVRLFATFSTDMGATFLPSFPVSDGVTEAVPLVIGPAQSTLGDYTALDFHGGVFYPVWGDNSETVSGNEGWLRINLGGPQVTEAGGEVWEADGAYLGQPAGAAVALATTQDALSVKKRPAPAPVYQSARHSANVPAGQEHRLSINLAESTYDLRIHLSSPSELAPPQGNHQFNVFLENEQVLFNYDPSADPALNPQPGRDKVVVREFWSRSVSAEGLQIRSVPVPPQGQTNGDSFELAIETAPTTHSDLHTRKIVVREVQP